MEPKSLELFMKWYKKVGKKATLTELLELWNDDSTTPITEKMVSEYLKR